MTLANALFKDIEAINAYDFNVAPCDDCKVCSHKPWCKHKDMMDTLVQKLFTVDTLVIISPIYFGALTDQTLKILNRFQRFFGAKFDLNAPYPFLKRIYIVSTCGADNPAMFAGAELTLSILKSLFNAKHAELFSALNTDTINPLDEANKERIKHYKDKIKSAER